MVWHSLQNAGQAGATYLSEKELIIFNLLQLIFLYSLMSVDAT